MHITIGTRSSKLALWQAEYVQARLQQGGIGSSLVLIDTKGDQILDRSLSKVGTKGIFTQELEDQLRAGSIDIAVHSAKDMPSTLPTGLTLIAFTERENPNDVLISRNPNLKLGNGQSFLVGTSSTRRVALLKHYYPNLKTVTIRGNLQTRLRKLDEGQCDALLLAFAGVHRMGYDELITDILPLDTFTPAVGQGSIAVEAAYTLPTDKLNAVVSLTNHEPTALCLRAERAFLARLEGGCSIPSFALAQRIGDQISLSGGLVSLDGQTLLRETAEGPEPEAEAIGKSLAETILTRGGDTILEAIRAQL